MQITGVGSEAGQATDVIYRLSLLTEILIVFLAIFDMYVWFFPPTFLNFTWMGINNLIEMSTLNVMNDWYCILEFNYVYLNRSINNNSTGCPG